MRFYKIIIVSFLIFGFISCGGNSKPATPLDTLKAYHEAVRKKDATTMKLLLSAGSLKIHQAEAQAQGLTLDDIVLRDTLFPVDQKVFKKRNEKIEGDRASIEVENNFGGYDTIFLVLEDGLWKIDKKATSDQMIQKIETSNDDFEDQINKDREKIEDSIEKLATPDPDASPSVSPADDPTSSDPDATNTPPMTDSAPPAAVPMPQSKTNK